MARLAVPGPAAALRTCDRPCGPGQQRLRAESGEVLAPSGIGSSSHPAPTRATLMPTRLPPRGSVMSRPRGNGVSGLCPSEMSGLVSWGRTSFPPICSAACVEPPLWTTGDCPARGWIPEASCSQPLAHGQLCFPGVSPARAELRRSSCVVSAERVLISLG